MSVTQDQEGREMWTGEVPAHWKVLKTKVLFRNARDRKLEGDEQLSATQKYGVIPQRLFMEQEETRVMLALSGIENFKHVDQDDFVISLRSFEGGIERCFYGGCVSPAYTVMKPNLELAPGYFQYLFKSRQYIREMQLGVYGIRDGKAINFEDVCRIRLPVPPIEEQSAIASYLDIETARIDGLIEEKRRLACMLVELRGGVIRERTTGADLKVARVSTGDVFMPQLPAGWDLVGLGRYSRITNGSTPLKDNLAYWQGGHYPWLNSSVVNGDEVTEGSELVTAEALRQCHLPIVPQGSVLVALTGQGKTRGQATVLRIEATINQHLAAIVCDEDHLDGEFVFWALTGQYAALRMVSDGQGGTKGALTCDELGRFRIPKPPLDEQRLIAKALYDETRKIDDLLKHVEDEIQLLRELRAATITDAVLGRIDVREHMKN